MKKKGLSIFLVILLMICSVFVAYLIADKMAKKNNSAFDSTTESQREETEHLGDMIFLVENKEKDYHFYLQNGRVVMFHNDKEYYFDNWSENITLETPKLVIKDIDDDSEEEVLIQVVDSVADEKKYYDVYILNHFIISETEETYRVNAITPSVAASLLSEKTAIQITQDPNCPKNGIVAMNVVGFTINYDRETGVPDSAYYMFKSLQDNNGDYLTVNGWERGRFSCYIDEDEAISVDANMIISYTSGDKQEAGSLRYKITINEKCTVDIAYRSMNFVAYTEYKLYKYNFNNESWTSRVNNSNSTIPRDKTIDFIQFTTAYNENVSTIDFSTNNSDLNAISSIVANEEYIELTAKKGCSFSESIVAKQEYSVPLKYETSTQTRNIDISYTASVTKDSNGNEVLRINFDKKYNQSVMKELTINFGVK